MSKTRKLFLVLLSLCFAVAMSMSFGIVGFAADETPVTVSAVDTVASVSYTHLTLPTTSRV